MNKFKKSKPFKKKELETIENKEKKRVVKKIGFDSEQARKGGIASGKARRKNKALSEIFKTLLEIKGNKIKGMASAFAELRTYYGLNENVDFRLVDYMALSQIQKAVDEKDTKAFAEVLNRAYGKPASSLELTGSIGTNISIISLIKDLDKREHTHAIEVEPVDDNKQNI